jgi:hypothetical protein
MWKGRSLGLRVSNRVGFVMSYRLAYYRRLPANRLSVALSGYAFATTLLITAAVLLVPAAFLFTVRELGLLAAGSTLWSCAPPLTLELAVAIGLAVLLTHEASEMGCEARLLTEIFKTLETDPSFETESARWRRWRHAAPYLGVVAGIPAACLIAYLLVLVIP